MKATGKLDRALRELGYGYAKPYYLRFNSTRRLEEAWQFERSSQGTTVQALVFYPVDESGVGISPQEVEYLYPDGRATVAPRSSEGFWSSEMLGELSRTLPMWDKNAFSRLTDPETMIRVYDFLMDSSGSASKATPDFPDLARCPIARKVTPNRLTGKAAYLMLVGRFAEARELIARIPPKLVTPADRKILQDVEAGEVLVPTNLLAYLQSIGAQTV